MATKSGENLFALMSPDEYLEKTGITAVMKDLVTVLLENRPANPVVFISD